MDTATAAPEQEQAPTPVEDSPPDRTEARLFRFSDYVHVGEGSADCEHGTDGKCRDEDHFHAWVRLPNKFQIVQIKERAQAARSRVIRQSKDPETDRWEIINNQVMEARMTGSEGMTAELLQRKEWRYMNQAMRELINDDNAEDSGESEDAPVSQWATVEEDQRRYRHLSELPEDERDADEFGELTRHLAAWNEALDVRYQELITPEREALEARSEDELGDMVRDIAATEQADSIYMREFTRQEMVVCTLRPNGTKHPKDRTFGDVEQLSSESPEVVAGLEAIFNELENELSNRVSLRAEGN